MCWDGCGLVRQKNDLLRSAGCERLGEWHSRSPSSSVPLTQRYEPSSTDNDIAYQAMTAYNRSHFVTVITMLESDLTATAAALHRPPLVATMRPYLYTQRGGHSFVPSEWQLDESLNTRSTELEALVLANPVGQDAIAAMTQPVVPVASLSTNDSKKSSHSTPTPNGAATSTIVGQWYDGVKGQVPLGNVLHSMKAANLMAGIKRDSRGSLELHFDSPQIPITRCILFIPPNFPNDNAILQLSPAPGSPLPPTRVPIIFAGTLTSLNDTRTADRFVDKILEQLRTLLPPSRVQSQQPPPPPTKIRVDSKEVASDDTTPLHTNGVSSKQSNWRMGQQVDALANDGNWCEAVIQRIDDRNGFHQYYVNFPAFDASYNEWVTSAHLSPAGTHTKATPQPEPGLTIDSNVAAITNLPPSSPSPSPLPSTLPPSSHGSRARTNSAPPSRAHNINVSSTPPSIPSPQLSPSPPNTMMNGMTQPSSATKLASAPSSLITSPSTSDINTMTLILTSEQQQGMSLIDKNVSGGDLLGVWLTDSTPLIQTVLGNGPNSEVVGHRSLSDGEWLNRQLSIHIDGGGNQPSQQHLGEWRSYPLNAKASMVMKPRPSDLDTAARILMYHTRYILCYTCGTEIRAWIIHRGSSLYELKVVPLAIQLTVRAAIPSLINSATTNVGLAPATSMARPIPSLPSEPVSLFGNSVSAPVGPTNRDKWYTRNDDGALLLNKITGWMDDLFVNRTRIDSSHNDGLLRLHSKMSLPPYQPVTIIFPSDFPFVNARLIVGGDNGGEAIIEYRLRPNDDIRTQARDFVYKARDTVKYIRPTRVPPTPPQEKTTTTTTTQTSPIVPPLPTSTSTGTVTPPRSSLITTISPDKPLSINIGMNPSVATSSVSSPFFRSPTSFKVKDTVNVGKLLYKKTHSLFHQLVN
jgi:hypothetical protein